MLLVLLLAAVAFADNGGCGYGDVDLSPLVKPAGSKDYEYTSGETIWYINPCSNTVHICEGDPATAPAVENYDHGQPYACFNLGAPVSRSTGAWAKLGDGVTVTYTGGDTCYSKTPPGSYDVTLNFHCKSGEEGALETVRQGDTACIFVAEFYTKHACGGGGSGSGVGGWVFNGIVLIGLFLYFAIGFGYNFKAKDLRGKEAIPNHEFWSGLPGLVIDGCKYTWHLIKKLFSLCGVCKEEGETYAPVSNETPPSYGSTQPATGTTA